MYKVWAFHILGLTLPQNAAFNNRKFRGRVCLLGQRVASWETLLYYLALCAVGVLNCRRFTEACVL